MGLAKIRGEKRPEAPLQRGTAPQGHPLIRFPSAAPVNEHQRVSAADPASAGDSRTQTNADDADMAAPMICSVILFNSLSVPSVSLWCNSYLYIEGLAGVVAEDVDHLAQEISPQRHREHGGRVIVPSDQ